MARHSFGEPINEDDILVVQGIEYPMMPIGMRAMRRLLVLKNTVGDRGENDELTEDDINLATDIVVNSVRPESRERFHEHIEESVPPNLLIEIATAVMRSFSDLDPTPPELSSGGSSATGPASTDGASVAELTPSV